MASESVGLEPEKQQLLVRVDLYEEWRKREGVPLVGGVYIRDLKEVEVGPWPRKGGGVLGALCYLDGDDDRDEHIVELPPGGATGPLRHMYTESIYILSGRGSTTLWRDEGSKQTFEWGPGSHFVLPTNAWHQFFNGSLSRSARWWSVTDLPELLRHWFSEDFVFNNPYDFRDRYAGEPDYFSAEAKLYRGRVWETNFIPDIMEMTLYDWSSRGGAGTNASMIMLAGTRRNHVSQFQPGYYKKGHRHGPGAHIFIVSGEGFVLIQRGDEPRIRCDWKEHSLYLSGAGPGDNWLHQHFNVGRTPATYLVMGGHLPGKYVTSRWRANDSTVISVAEVSEKEGGYQVEYEDEDPEIHRIFEEALRKRGITCKMKNMVPWCTGEPGAESSIAHFLDEH